jgi:anti-sigma factor RsiW
MDCPAHDSGKSGILVSYAAGALSGAELEALERHLEVCAGCRRVAGAQREVWAALDLWSPAPVPADFDKRLFERIAAEGSRRWWHFVLRPEFSFRFGSAAPVAAACLALVIALMLRAPQAPHPVALPPAAAAVSTAPAKIDADQVERSLDDIEMLKQVGFAADGSDSPS